MSRFTESACLRRSLRKGGEGNTLPKTPLPHTPFPRNSNALPANHRRSIPAVCAASILGGDRHQERAHDRPHPLEPDRPGAAARHHRLAVGPAGGLGTRCGSTIWRVCRRRPVRGVTGVGISTLRERARRAGWRRADQPWPEPTPLDPDDEGAGPGGRHQRRSGPAGAGRPRPGGRAPHEALRAARRCRRGPALAPAYAIRSTPNRPTCRSG
jgi:hypothetical protein